MILSLSTLSTHTCKISNEDTNQAIKQSNNLKKILASHVWKSLRSSTTLWWQSFTWWNKPLTNQTISQMAHLRAVLGPDRGRDRAQQRANRNGPHQECQQRGNVSLINQKIHNSIIHSVFVINQNIDWSINQYMYHVVSNHVHVSLDYPSRWLIRAVNSVTRRK